MMPLQGPPGQLCVMQSDQCYLHYQLLSGQTIPGPHQGLPGELEGDVFPITKRLYSGWSEILKGLKLTALLVVEST
jgi:hypothetical protein